MQCDDEDTSCMVYQAEYPPQGNCRWVIEALIMASHVHEGVHHTVYGGQGGQTLEKPAAAWRSRSDQVWLIGQSVSWAHVKANVVVKPVSAPIVSDL